MSSSQEVVNEYRMVRKSLYLAGTFRAVMQGHYIRAKTFEEALEEMQRRYPGELIDGELWKSCVPIFHN